MGQTTTNLQIWTPDTSDKHKLDVVLATMAASLENGVGPRLQLQEMAIGLKVSLDAGAWTIPAGSPATVIPYAVTASRGDFNKGFTYSAGMATIVTPGMYFVTASIGPNGDTSGSSKGIKIQVEKNGAFIGGNEVAGAPNWISSPVSAVVNCIAGDTIRAKAGYVNSATGIGNNDFSSHMSIVMVQAVPQ